MTQDSRFRGLVPFAKFLVRYRMWLLAAAVLLTALSFMKASQLTLEHSIESLYALDDPHLLDYRESKSLFGGDEFVIVAYADPELLSPEHLDALRDVFRPVERRCRECGRRARRTSPRFSRPCRRRICRESSDSCWPHSFSNAALN